MAFEISDGAGTPHATNYSDLLDKLITFLVGTGVWNLHNDQRGTVGEVTLRGEGLAGTENIYVGIKRYIDAINDIHGWHLQGYTGFTNAGFLINPGAITGTYLPVMPLWNSTIPYWFFANARRFIVIAKVDTVYMSMYAGHILPYGSPGHWFYPLLIGGSQISTGSGILTMPRYSNTDTEMCSPFMSQSGFVFSTGRSNICIRTADGTWLRLYNTVGSFIAPGGTSPDDNMTTLHGVFPPAQNLGILGSYGIGTSTAGYKQCRPNQAGAYPLVPLRLLAKDAPDALGIYDGVCYVPGYGVTSEDVVDDGVDEYIVFHDVFRTNLGSYFAVKKA
jgi:hypothetical protein